MCIIPLGDTIKYSFTFANSLISWFTFNLYLLCGYYISLIQWINLIGVVLPYLAKNAMASSPVINNFKCSFT